MNVTVTLVTYCCEEKRQDPTPLPAVARYLDPRIKTVWERAQSERRPMLILSGLLGLLRPETPIMWYDRQLTPQEVGPLVDLVAHQLLAHGVAAVEYVTQNVWLSPAVKPYHDLLAAACQRQGIAMTVTELEASAGATSDQPHPTPSAADLHQEPGEG